MGEPGKRVKRVRFALPDENNDPKPPPVPSKRKEPDSEHEIFAGDRLRGEELEPGDRSLAEEDDGRALTAFNLSDELEDGYVDADGNFVEGRVTKRAVEDDSSSSSSAGGDEEEKTSVALSKKKPDEAENDERYADAWVSELSSAAAYVHAKPELPTAKRRRSDRASGSGPGDLPSTEQALSPQDAAAKLSEFLKLGEKVAHALRRLGRRSSPSYDAQAFSEMTDLADVLVNAGRPGVFQETAADLRGDRWELRWGSDGQVLGPFASAVMRGWFAAGYFAARTDGRDAHVRDLRTDGPFVLARTQEFG